MLPGAGTDSEVLSQNETLSAEPRVKSQSIKRKTRSYILGVKVKKGAVCEPTEEAPYLTGIEHQR